MNLRLGDHCGLYLSELAVENDLIWVLDGDLADSDGACHFAERHPERFIMAGIAEQCMVSLAAGMASCGLRPWVFSFAAFLCYRAYDQIRVCLSQTKQPVTLVGSHSGGCTGRNGKTHAALNDIALIASLPHFSVWSPAGPKDLKFAVRRILESDKPAYLRLPRQNVTDPPGNPAPWRWLSQPSPIIIVSTGITTHLALETIVELAQQGISIGLIHCLQLTPFPKIALQDSLRSAKWIFVIEDHYALGGLACFLHQIELSGQVVQINWPHDWSGQSGSDEEILQKYGFSAKQLAAKIRIIVE